MIIDNIYKNFNLEDDEEIKQIEGYEAYYLSNYGKVFSTKNNKLICMHPTIDKNGYHYIDISNKDGLKRFAIHRLVCQYFCPKVDEKNVVNHIDAVKSNNYYKNLEWVTTVENVRKSYITSHINQVRNYSYHLLVSPDNKILGLFKTRSQLNKFVKEKKLPCFYKSLGVYGFSCGYRTFTFEKDKFENMPFMKELCKVVFKNE